MVRTICLTLQKAIVIIFLSLLIAFQTLN